MPLSLPAVNLACSQCGAPEQGVHDRSATLTHAGTKGLILLDQIRTVDKVRLIKPLGRVSAKVLAQALQTLQEVFAP